MQLACGERLLRGVQEPVHLQPRAIGFLLRRVDLGEAPLLDRDQRRFEARRQRVCAHAALQRLPALRQLRVVDRRARGELLGFDDERLGAGERVELLRPALDPLLGLVELRQRRRIGRLDGRFAQLGEFLQQSGQRLRRRGRFCLRKPFLEAAIEAGARALLLVLAIETRLQRLARDVAARETRRIVGELQRFPPAIELDHRGEHRAGPRRQRLELLQDRVRFGSVSLAACDRIDPLARGPGNAAILVFGGVGELAQSLRGLHALRGRLARFRMRRGERKLDQRTFVADRGDRVPATLRLRGAPRGVGADVVGARVGGYERRRARGIVRLRERGTERRREREPDRRIRFLLPCGGERAEACAAGRRGEPDLRSGIAGEKCRELVRCRRQLGDTGDTAGGIGVEMRRGAKQVFGDHGVRCGENGSLRGRAD